MLRFGIARSCGDLDKLQDVWESLWKHSEGLTIFQSFAWNRVAACVFGQREQPLVIHAEDSNCAVILPASLSCTGRREVSLIGEKLFDYGDFLQAGDPRLINSAWEELRKLAMPFKLEAVRADSPHRRWWNLQGAAPFSASPMAANLSAEDFRRRHSRSARLLRRLERAGVTLRQHSGKNLPLLQCIYAKKGQQKTSLENLFRDPLRQSFMLAMARLCPNHFEIFTLETASALVAAIVTLRDRDVRRFYTTYFDAAWTPMSPGAALLFEATRLSLEQGVICDYMTGEQPYKMRLATGAVPLFRVHLPVETPALHTEMLQAA